jgi:hypothetical protein
VTTFAVSKLEERKMKGWAIEKSPILLFHILEAPILFSPNVFM